MITDANRIQRLYVTLDYSSESVVTLATYVVKIFYLIWLAIKDKPSYKNGTRLISKVIAPSKYLFTELKGKIDKVSFKKQLRTS